MKHLLITCVVLALGLLPMNTVRSQERADNIKFIDLDKKIVKSCYDAALLGTEIFNKGNYEGCYRLYQGTLMALQPLLDYRPNLMFKVKDKLERARTMKVWEGAGELRSALDEIQNEIAPVTKNDLKTESKDPVPAPATLFERLGGTAGVRRMINSVLLVAVEDPKVNLLKGKKYDAKDWDSVKQNVLEYIRSITGGPGTFNSKDAKVAFANIKLNNDEYSALLGIVETTLQKNSIAPADIQELMGKLESARKDVVEPKSKQ